MKDGALDRAKDLIKGVRDRMMADGYHYPNDELEDLAEALAELGCDEKESRGIPERDDDEEGSV